MFGKRIKHVKVILDAENSKRIRNAIVIKGGVKYLIRKRINKNTAYLYLNGRRKLPLWVYLEVEDSAQREIKLKMDTNLSLTVNLPFYITKELSYFIGAMRDGWLICIKGCPIGIGLEQVDKHWLMKMAVLIEKTLGIKPRISGTTLIAYSEILARYFIVYFDMPLHGQRSWGMPKAIENSEKPIKKAFVEGFLDAEGYIKSLKDDPQIVFYQNNREVLKKIKEFLNECGIKSGGILRDKRSKNHRLSICERNSLKKFSKIFKSRLVKKQKKLEFLKTLS